MNIESVYAGLITDILLQMEEQNISQTELARRLKVSRQRVHQLLYYQNSMELRTLLSIIEALGCDLGISLFRGAEGNDSALAAKGDLGNVGGYDDE